MKWMYPISVKNVRYLWRERELCTTEMNRCTSSVEDNNFDSLCTFFVLYAYFIAFPPIQLNSFTIEHTPISICIQFKYCACSFIGETRIYDLNKFEVSTNLWFRHHFTQNIFYFVFFPLETAKYFFTLVLVFVLWQIWISHAHLYLSKSKILTWWLIMLAQPVKFFSASEYCWRIRLFRFFCLFRSKVFCLWISANFSWCVRAIIVFAARIPKMLFVLTCQSYDDD